MLDRYDLRNLPPADAAAGPPLVLLLPGSRRAELERHLPAMFGALRIIRAAGPAMRARMVLSSSALVQQAVKAGLPAGLEVREGGLAESLAEATLALASTGTVTMECACFGVPAVTLYKASRRDYEIAKRIVKVKSLTMPNLLAGELLFPEFIQDAATPENLGRAALELLRDEARREKVRGKLKEIVASLGGPGASRRAAEAILKTLG